MQLFGWDNGVTGGVVSMRGFLEQFFPETIGKESTPSGDLYCTYNNQKIQWFTSSLFLAGAATEVSGTTISTSSKPFQPPGNVLQYGPEGCAATGMWE